MTRGLDLGITNDRAALVVLASSPIEYRIRLVRCQSWAPGPSGQVDLEAVRIAVLQAQYDFRPANVCFDPYARKLMSQQLRRSGVNMVQINFTGKGVERDGHAVLADLPQFARSGCTHDEELIRDISRISIEERPFGYKLTAPRERRTATRTGQRPWPWPCSVPITSSRRSIRPTILCHHHCCRQRICALAAHAPTKEHCYATRTNPSQRIDLLGRLATPSQTANTGLSAASKSLDFRAETNAVTRPRPCVRPPASTKAPA